jgi:ABC-type multidrug transport system ATPase subunit
MIEVENLSKRYGDKLAVDGLNFVVQPGTVTGFLGPNGAGKSTTMRWWPCSVDVDVQTWMFTGHASRAGWRDLR